MSFRRRKRRLNRGGKEKGERIDSQGRARGNNLAAVTLREGKSKKSPERKPVDI